MDIKRFELRIARSENLPMLPHVVSQVLQASYKKEVNIGEVEQIIERDVAIMAKILRVANSAYYGVGNCNSISTAISLLGFNTIRSLMVSIAYYQIMSGKAHSDSLSKPELWKHSLAVAVGAKIIGKMVSPLEVEELYVAGLMHDIGFLIMDMYAPRDLDRILKVARTEGRPIHEVEQQILRWDHSDAGRILANKWCLPSIMMNAISYHHKPMMTEEHQSAICVISMANSLAHMCGFTNNTIGYTYEIEPFVQEFLNIPEEQITIIKEMMVDEVMQAQDALRF